MWKHCITTTKGTICVFSDKKIAEMTLFTRNSSNSKSLYESLEWNKLPISSATTPPSSWYTDKEFYTQVEKSKTFKSWLYGCRVDEMKNIGDYVAINIMDQPILIVKQSIDSTQDSTNETAYKAYFNVCRHHAAQICDNGTGTIGESGRFTCPYHGWQYDRLGRLVKAVQMKGCASFSPKNFGLKPILVDQVGPWLFINLGSSEHQSLLKDQPDVSKLTDILNSTNYSSLTHVAKRSYHIKCNWKVFIDNYLDGGYHVPIAHPALSAELDMNSYERIGYENFYLQTCLTANKAIADSNRLGGTTNNPNKAIYAFHYPNLCINRYGRWMDTNIVWPISVNECVVDIDWYLEKSEGGGQIEDDELIANSLKDSDQVQQEDIWLCERVQRGLESDGYDVGRYAPLVEGGEYMFHSKLYEDYLSIRIAYFAGIFKLYLVSPTVIFN
eukprot:gene11393-15273_t